MLFSHLTTVVLYAAVTGVSAGCYKSGTSGHKGKGLEKNWVIDSVAGMMSGYYKAGEERTQCANDADKEGVKWGFWVLNKSSGEKYVSKETIGDWLYAEATGCEYGGRSEHGNGDWKWEINSDPNAGMCMDLNNGGPLKVKRTAIEFEA